MNCFGIGIDVIRMLYHQFTIESLSTFPIFFSQVFCRSFQVLMTHSLAQILNTNSAVDQTSDIELDNLGANIPLPTCEHESVNGSSIHNHRHDSPQLRKQFVPHFGPTIVIAIESPKREYENINISSIHNHRHESPLLRKQFVLHYGNTNYLINQPKNTSSNIN